VWEKTVHILNENFWIFLSFKRKRKTHLIKVYFIKKMLLMKEINAISDLLCRSLQNSKCQLRLVRMLQWLQLVDHCKPNSSSMLLLGSTETPRAMRYMVLRASFSWCCVVLLYLARIFGCTDSHKLYYAYLKVFVGIIAYVGIFHTVLYYYKYLTVICSYRQFLYWSFAVVMKLCLY